MKIFTLITVLAIAPIVLAHPDHFPPEHPSDHPEHPEHPSDHPEHPAKKADAGAEGKAEAKAILVKVSEKYKKATGIKETISVSMPAMMGGDDEKMIIELLVSDTSGSLSLQEQMTATWIDGTFYFEVDGVEDKFFQTKVASFYEGLINIGEGGAIPGLTTVALRESDDFDAWVSTLTMGMPGGVTVVGVSEDTDAEGNAVDVINCKTMMGTLDITVSKDSVLTGGVLTIEQPGMPGMAISTSSVVEFLKSAPEITFDAGKREAVSTPEDLMGEFEEGPDQEEVDLTGKAAPDFTLARMDGSGDVTLSSLKGKVVVLDFWATWCPPCRAGLPFLNEFDAWADEEGLDVMVFAVNVWEKGTPANVATTIKKFWADNKFSTAVLMGSGDDALTGKYGINGIPTTVIIGTDGSIATQNSGFTSGEEMLKDLKEAVTTALAK
jgi:thiol-disulfide isomerase/thioredoxin